MTSFVILTTSQASVLSSAKRRIESLPNTLSGTQRLRWAFPSSNTSRSSLSSSKERCRLSRRLRPSWGSPRSHEGLCGRDKKRRTLGGKRPPVWSAEIQIPPPNKVEKTSYTLYDVEIPEKVADGGIPPTPPRPGGPPPRGP